MFFFPGCSSEGLKEYSIKVSWRGKSSTLCCGSLHKAPWCCVDNQPQHCRQFPSFRTITSHVQSERETFRKKIPVLQHTVGSVNSEDSQGFALRTRAECSIFFQKGYAGGTETNMALCQMKSALCHLTVHSAVDKAADKRTAAVQTWKVDFSFLNRFLLNRNHNTFANLEYLQNLQLLTEKALQPV